MLRHVCPSVRLSTTQLSLDRVSLQFTCMFESFTKICITEVLLKYDESKVHTFMFMFRLLRDK
jgi:hypothetical protein